MSSKVVRPVHTDSGVKARLVPFLPGSLLQVYILLTGLLKALLYTHEVYLICIYEMLFAPLVVPL